MPHGIGEGPYASCDVESNALYNWKLKIFKIIDERVLFYSNNLDLHPPKPKLSFR